MKLHLVDINSSISEDSFKEGIGASTGCGLQDEKIGRTFEGMPEMLKFLAGTYGLSANEADYEHCSGRLRTEKMVADHSQAQNGGWFEPTPAELTAWLKGTQKLFTEEFDIRYLRVA